MKRTICDYIVFVLSILGSIASIYGMVQLGQHLSDQGVVAVFFLGVIALYFMFYNYILISSYRRKIKYADAYEDIVLGISQLNNIELKGNPAADIKSIVDNLSLLCDSLSAAFSNLYDNKISVCIKFLVSDKDRPRVETLTRDKKSKAQRKTGDADTTRHWLDGNTDFEYLYTNLDGDEVVEYYHEGHLPICKDYKNTRIKTNSLISSKNTFLENYLRRKNWPLAYKATLVVPIIPLLANNHSKRKVRGFLCIDKKEEGDFNVDVDVKILQGISDLIFNYIDKLHILSKTNENG